MPTPTLPAGIGDERTADQANQFMRAQPWYQQLLASMGQNPNAVHLNTQQAQQVLAEARRRGIGISNDYEIDPGGNINSVGHKLRNGLLIAAGAGAVAAPYLIPLMTSAGGAAGGGAAAAGALGPSTAANMAATAGIVGGSTVPAGIAAGGSLSTAASLGGYLGTAGKVANALGNIGAGRQADRVNEAQIGIGQNRNIIDLYRAQQDATDSQNNFGLNKVNAGVNVGRLDLDQKQFSLDAPGKRASTAVRGDILANAKDATVSGISPNIPVPTISGGLRPSMFSDATRQLGGLMSQGALDSQKAGDNFGPLPSVPDYVPGPTAPSLTGMPQATGLDSILNTAATIGSIGGAMGSIPYRRVPQPGDADYIPPTPRR